jgi:aminoglycoside N3'-acetyltransferase
MLKKTHKQELVKHLVKLGLKKDQKIVLHANLATFGIPSVNFPDFVIKSILEILGPNGSLIMPMYNLNLNPKIIYDKKKLYNIRAISSIYKEFFKVKEKIISNSFVHRHFGIGENIDFLGHGDPGISLGKNSDFEKFYQNNFLLVLLGCKPSEGATYLHHLESIKKVPYRTWINLPRKILDKKKLDIKIKYFARKNSNFKEDFDKVFEYKTISSKTKKIGNKYGFSFMINIKDLHNAGLKILNKNIYAFVKKK